ncbi:MAG: MFS transporter [Treponema sp.]|jgi:PPP family 3-phenylpropionic acid transporter|nr:MFS transporter [Treponema sp.]
MIKTKRFSFSAIYFFGWAALATYALDFVYYSEKIGFTSSEIGFIYAVKVLLGIALQPLFGFICDYIKSTRKILILMGAASILLSIFLPTASAKLAILLIVFGNVAAICAFMPLLDSWAARECIDEEKFHFGSLRMWGSIGFAIVAFIYGRMSMNFDITYMYYGRAIFFVATLLFLFFNQYDDNRQAAASKISAFRRAKEEKPAVRELFAKKEYWLFFIFLFIFCFPISAANTFFPRLLLEKGSTSQIIALFGSINALVEVPFLLYARKLTRKAGSRGLILVGGAFAVMRMVGFAFAPTIPLLLTSHLCIAPYVGFFIPGFIYHSYSIAPKNTQAFTLTTLQGLAIGISGMLSSYFGGIIVESAGIQSMFAYYSIFSIVGFLMYIVISLPKKNSVE